MEQNFEQQVNNYNEGTWQQLMADITLQKLPIDDNDDDQLFCSSKLCPKLSISTSNSPHTTNIHPVLISVSTLPNGSYTTQNLNIVAAPTICKSISTRKEHVPSTKTHPTQLQTLPTNIKTTSNTHN